MLARRVRFQQRLRGDGRQRCGIDDVALVFLVQNARHKGTDAVDDAQEIGPQDPIPSF